MSNETRSVLRMGHLWDLIQAHIDAAVYTPSERELARRMGVSPTALAGWRRLSTRLPSVENLEAISRVIGVPYNTVLDAALYDTGYRPPRAPRAAPHPSSNMRATGADGSRDPHPDDLDLAAMAKPAGGTERERWDRVHGGAGEESQDSGGIDPA